MAKMSLLDIVQEILSDMNSDNVNSISDTIEATQVANIVRRTFYNLFNDRIWPHQAKLIRLNSSADSTRPTHMNMDENVINIEWVKYDIRREIGDPIKYRTIEYKTPSEFLAWVMERDASKSNMMTVIDYNGTPLIIQTDAAPSFYTSFDDEHLVFDSFDNTMDSILQHSKTQVYAQVEPEFRLEDSFVPDMPSKVFPYFVNEAKSVCFLKIKEVFSQKDEQASNRQKSWLAKEKHRVGGGIRFPDYGRRRP